MPSPFQRVATADRALNQVQDNIARTLAPIAANALLDGRVIGPVTFVSGTLQQVAHTLPKRASMVLWMPLSPDGVGHVYGSAPTDDRFLSLTANRDLTLYFLVF